MKTNLLFLLLSLTLLYPTSYAQEVKPELKIQNGHFSSRGFRNKIEKMAISNSEKWIITGGEDNIIILWDVSSGREICNFIGHSDKIIDLTFTNDNQFIWSVSKDQTVRKWKLSDQKEVLQFKIGDNKPLAFSPNRNSLICSSPNFELQVWSLESNSLIQTFKGHSNRINCAIFTKNGEYLFTGSDDQSVKKWHFESQQLVDSIYLEIKRSWNKITSLSLSPDETKLCVIGWSNFAVIVDLQNNHKLTSIKTEIGFLDSCLFTEDGKKLILGGLVNLEIWDSSNLTLLKKYPNKVSPSIGYWTQQLLVLKDNKNILINSMHIDKPQLLVLNIERDTQSQIIKGLTQEHSTLTVSKSGKLMATGFGEYGTSGGVRIWNTETLEEVDYYRDDKHGSINSIAFFPNERALIYGHHIDSTITLYQIHSDAAIKVGDAGEGILSVAISPNANYLVSGGSIEDDGISRGRVFLIGIADSEASCYYNLESMVYSVAFSQDEEKIVLGFDDGSIKIWDTKIGISERRDKEIDVSAHDTRVWDIKFSPDGQYFISGSNEIILWDAMSLNKISVFSGDFGQVKSLDFSPDGQYFISGSFEGDVLIWNTHTGKIEKRLKGHTDDVTSVAWIPNTNRVVTTSIDHTLRMWDISTGEEVCRVYTLDGKNNYIKVIPDGYFFAFKDGLEGIHYLINQDVYLFDQFDIRYNRPDKVLESIGLAPKELIEMYRKAYIKRLEKLGIDSLKIKKYLEGDFSMEFNAPNIFRGDNEYFYEQSKPNFRLNFKAEDAKYALNRYQVFVNGVSVFGRKGKDISQAKSKKTEQNLDILLSEGSNIIEVEVYNEEDVKSLTERFEVAYTPAQAALPTLYLISIGVSNYQDANMNLGFARKDAEDVAQMLTQQQGRYGKIIIEKLLDTDFNKSKIAQLKQKLLQSQVQDEVIIFYAGHGLLDSELDYYLATSQTNFSKPNDGKSILYDELEDLLDGIPARQKMLLVDACHSGEVDKEEYTNLAENTEKGELTFRGFKRRGDGVQIGLQNSFELMRELFTDLRKGTGATVLSSAGGGEFAYEGKDWNNGVFTYCFLSGLKDKKADLNKDGKIMLSELQEYLGNAVSTLTKGLQTPTSRIENISNDWRVW